MSIASSTRLPNIGVAKEEAETSTLASPDPSSSASVDVKSKEPFVPLLPDDFFAVWDAAKARAAGTARRANDLGGTTPAGSTGILGEWQSWRDHLPGEESESGSDFEGDDAEGSVIYRLDGGGVGDSSFDSEEAVGVMETPRPRSGFQ